MDPKIRSLMIGTTMWSVSLTSLLIVTLDKLDKSIKSSKK